jgi:hypothetical protein
MGGAGRKRDSAGGANTGGPASGYLIAHPGHRRLEHIRTSLHSSVSVVTEV